MVRSSATYHSTSYSSIDCRRIEVSDTRRDTQFRGSAKLLIEAIDKLTDDFCKEPFDKGIKALARDIDASDVYEESVQTLVAQWAYDLLYFQIEQTYGDSPLHGEIQESMKFMHDMTEWPRKD
jgi:hypothetical protein